MKFTNFLNESKTNKRISAVQFEKLSKLAFGGFAKMESSGRGNVKDIANVSKLKNALEKISHKDLYDIIVNAAEEAGVKLKPTDGTDKNAFIEAGPGGSDCLIFKVEGNDYKDNDPDGDFIGDLAFDLYDMNLLLS